LRVFITDGDVLINWNVNFWQNTSDNAYWPVIIATNPSHWNIYVWSRPDVYEWLLVRNNLIVDYNYKMFLVNGGALIRNNITCDRFALQVPEVFSEWKDWIYSWLINKDWREWYAYNALRNSCTVINNTKFSNFTLRKEFGQTKN
jgi:NDP-sugar pyrophosphorylase family protein